MAELHIRYIFIGHSSRKRVTIVKFLDKIAAGCYVSGDTTSLSSFRCTNNHSPQ